MIFVRKKKIATKISKKAIAYVLQCFKISDVQENAQKWYFRKIRVAGSKMGQFSKNDFFFCVLHTYFQDLKGVRIFPGQKTEMLPTLIYGTQ